MTLNGILPSTLANLAYRLAIVATDKTINLDKIRKNKFVCFFYLYRIKNSYALQKCSFTSFQNILKNKFLKTLHKTKYIYLKSLNFFVKKNSKKTNSQGYSANKNFVFSV